MTLNGVTALILRFWPISISLLAKYVAVVEYRPILSVNIVSQFQSSTFGHYTTTIHLFALCETNVQLAASSPGDESAHAA